MTHAPGAQDFRETGAEESYTEGVVDRLRAVEGTKVAALARELLDGERRPLEGLAALERRRRRRLGDRPRRGRRRAQGGGRASAPRWRPTSSSRSCATRSARSSERAVPDASTGSSSPTSRPARPRTTSRRVVRRTLGVRKAGHAGTLDPFATGLLVDPASGARGACSASSRRCRRSTSRPPVRRRLDHRRPRRRDHADRRAGARRAACCRPGAIRQRPPAYSAIRVGGVRAYERARRGEEVEIPEREVTIHAFEQLWREDDRAGFRIECSSGTYVRSLIADLGDAYTQELRRTRIGPFDVADADPARVIPLAERARACSAPRCSTARPRAAPSTASRSAAAGGVRAPTPRWARPRASERGAPARRGRPDRARRASARTAC